MANTADAQPPDSDFTPIGDLDLLRAVVRDLAPRRVGGLLKDDRQQAFTTDSFLTRAQWGAVDRAVEAVS